MKDTEDTIIEILKDNPLRGRDILSTGEATFVEAIDRADPNNRKRMKKAFPKLVKFLSDLSKEDPKILKERQFKSDLISLIQWANDKNREKLRKAYPELVKKYGRYK